MVRRIARTALAFRSRSRTLAANLRDLHGNEDGAEEGMNKLLIFAMVALPLLALLIVFGTEIVGFATEQWEEVFGGGGVPTS